MQSAGQISTVARKGPLAAIHPNLLDRLLANPKADATLQIIDLKCAVIGENPVVRIVTDERLSGYGQAENAKPYLKPQVLFCKQHLLGEDPTNVARVILKIMRLGGFKPWGAAVSAIEMAQWPATTRPTFWPICTARSK